MLDGLKPSRITNLPWVAPGRRPAPTASALYPAVVVGGAALRASATRSASAIVAPPLVP